jgi:hypothetical protein
MSMHYFTAIAQNQNFVGIEVILKEINSLYGKVKVST